MAPRTGASDARALPATPPPTAHRMAAWLSIAPGLLKLPAHEVRFPPSDNDVRAIVDLWQQRLGRLKAAGLEALRGHRAYDRALACKAHAFAYAGEGEVCRRPFCPFCAAADAA